jgi:hypothetical protein
MSKQSLAARKFSYTARREAMLFLVETPQGSSAF